MLSDTIEEIDSIKKKQNEMKVGQINLGTVSGNIIYDISKREDVNEIVEIGTWNGMGSTLCVIKGIEDSGKQKAFVSIELYRDMYEEAKSNLSEKSAMVNLLNGTIIEPSELGWFDESIIEEVIAAQKDLYGISYMHTALWYQKDIEHLKAAPNIMSSIPEKIDFLILDGGEYTTYPEWKRLKDRTRIVYLDDSNIFKCSKIRSEIIESGEYDTIYDNLNDRNGFSIFEKKKNL